MNNKGLTSTPAFASHMCKYIGVGLISGSIVHAGTLGGNSMQYIVLIALGVVLFIIGNLLEHGFSSIRELLPYIALSTALSIGTGMVSGGTQHYLDGPLVAAILFPVGFFLAYLSFIYRDFKKEFTFKRITFVIITSILLFLALSYIAKQLPQGGAHSHTSDETLKKVPSESDVHNH